jgi:UDP-glucose 4-epimerase
MKILVTGGTGYIGSHTVVELQNRGHEVIIIDNLSNSYRSVVDQIEKITGRKPGFEEFDLTDKEKTSAFFQQHSDLDGIIHFAAFKAVGESVEKPLKYYRNNLESLLNILGGIQEHKIPSLVFSSSCTVYGEPDELPVSESAPIKPATSPYGNTKQISEEIIKDTAGNSSFNAILLRYFNPIGAHESALIGELPIGVPNNLVPYITQTAAGIREQLNVFGDDYDTPDGTAIRDYIHVSDLAIAHIAALERMAQNKSKEKVEAFNVGTGNGYSVLEVIRAFENSTGEKLNYKIAPRRAGDVEKVWSETTLANNVLGWKAEKNIEEMMASAWKWQMALEKK